MVFNFVANSAAILSIASGTIDVASKGASRASKNAKTTVAIKDIRDYTGDSLLNTSSSKYNEMKKMVRSSDKLSGLYRIKGAIEGFLGGVAERIVDNALPLGFSILTLSFKNKITKTVGVAGMAITTAWDFIQNGTNLFADKDIIEK